MVNAIDRQKRHRLLAESVWAVIRRDGFDAASVRAVAAEAGLAPGSVRHFFRSQDELHIFAMEELARDVAAQMNSTLGPSIDLDALPRGAEARALAARLLAVLLPIDEKTTALYGAHMQFTVKAVVSPKLAPVARKLLEQIRSFAERIIVLMVEQGAAAPSTDIPTARNQLCAMLDGYALELLVDPDAFAPGEPEENLRAFLDSLVEGA